ncbi:MAG: hypothetical protein EOP47_27255 [Sphingobacteriaceae bacterium]|nr:MAG: hypothetical protein EOP47_27255 [Sphingobacteriaceae bacterium]
MKKNLILHAALMMMTLSSFAQTISNPHIQKSDDFITKIAKIETNSQYTIVYFKHTAVSDSSWIQVNKEIYIQTDVSNEHFNYVKSENIAIVPAKQYLKKTGDDLLFKVYFKKIPATAKSIDIIERAGLMHNGITYFNYYDVSLVNAVKVTDMVLVPPPPEGSFETGRLLDNMGPMMNSITKSTMDAQLQYYKQPGKIAEIAQVTKAYYNELRKAGFSEEQALKITASNGLLPKTTGNN